MSDINEETKTERLTKALQVDVEVRELQEALREHWMKRLGILNVLLNGTECFVQDRFGCVVCQGTAAQALKWLQDECAT